MAELVRVAGTADIKQGNGIVAEVNGQSLAVFNVNGTYHVIDNDCVHRGGPLGEGELDGEVVMCPWHNWTFNVITGRGVSNPAACVKSYPVTVEGSDIKVAL